MVLPDWLKYNYGCSLCNAKFELRKDAVQHTYDEHGDHPSVKQNKQIKARKQELKQIPFAFSAEDKLKQYPRFYLKLKDSFMHLPKLRDAMFKFSSKLGGHAAETNDFKKMVWVSKPVLRRDASIQDILGNDDWQVRTGTLLTLEILTHEIAHWGTRGGHNMRFYAKQKMYFNTMINKLISGELYK